MNKDDTRIAVRTAAIKMQERKIYPNPIALCNKSLWECTGMKCSECSILDDNYPGMYPEYGDKK
jgi:hypothetical protein